MAAVILSGIAPRIGLTLMGGYAADRLPRRVILIGTSGLRASVLLVLSVLTGLRLLGIPVLEMAAAVLGISAAFFAPAQRALLAETVSEAARQRQNALWIAVGQAMTVVGMATGALLLTLLGQGLTFARAALLYVGAGLALLPIPERASEVRSTAAPQQIREALSILRDRPFLPVGMAVAVLFTVFGEAPNVVLVPWLVRVHLGAGPVALAATWIAFSAGALLTTGLLSALRPAHRRGPVAFGMTTLAGLALAGSALALSPWQLWLFQFLVGAFAMIHGVLWEGILQEHVPREHFGKIGALEHTLGSAAYPFGLLLVGVLSGPVGGVGKSVV